MRGQRVWILARGLRTVRRSADVAALRTARSPHELARLAVVPAGRNLGIAVGLLAREQRAESAAALLACRVLDAYEDLDGSGSAKAAVLSACSYLMGDSDTPPPRLIAAAARDSEAVDLVLAERIDDVRALVAELPEPAGQRVRDMLVAVARTMATHLETPMTRITYADGVLGRVVHYACSLIAESTDVADITELAGCVGATAQLANDLRDGELEIYDVSDRDELTRAVMLRLLTPALGSFALLERMGPRTPSHGARAAMAYMAITTAAFLCDAVGAPGPYPPRLRLGAAFVAASTPARWAALLDRVRRSVDGAIKHLLNTDPHSAAPDATPELFAADMGSGATAMAPLIIESAFSLVHALPDSRLTGELPESETRLMMIADHLAFGALERVERDDWRALHDLGTRFQIAAQSIPMSATPAHPTSTPGVSR